MRIVKHTKLNLVKILKSNKPDGPGHVPGLFFAPAAGAAGPILPRHAGARVPVPGAAGGRGMIPAAGDRLALVPVPDACRWCWSCRRCP